MIAGRIDARGRTTIPAPVRAALDLRPGDSLDWRLDDGHAGARPDPFAAFDEWSSEADSKGCANL